MNLREKEDTRIIGLKFLPRCLLHFFLESFDGSSSLFLIFYIKIVFRSFLFETSFHREKIQWNIIFVNLLFCSGLERRKKSLAEIKTSNFSLLCGVWQFGYRGMKLLVKNGKTFLVGIR